MSFITIPGLKGKVFIPQESDRVFKKKPCKDCFSCQQCSDDRCRLCLGKRRSRFEKLSHEEFNGREENKI